MEEAVGCLHMGKKSWGGLMATEECQNCVCLSLSRVRKSRWVGKICLPLVSLLPEKEETVTQMTSLNRWSQ